MKKASSMPWSILLALGLAGQAFAQGCVSAAELGVPPQVAPAAPA